jgi:type II secretory pathway predicted ATPase ExeA
MLLDVMAHYGLSRDFRHAGFFETEQHKRIFRQLKTAIPNGYLIAVSGIVGSGKTTTLRRLQEILRKENKVIIAKSLSVEKSKTTLKTLVCALFYDVSGDKDYKVATVGEKRERELQELIRSAKKTVALFIDEAHDLHHPTLTGLKRLMEIIQDGGGKLSIILAGHPKLHNDLKGPRMEEVGYRTLTVSLDSMQGELREYIRWLLRECAAEGAKAADIIEEPAIDYLAERLSTPLQVEQHLTLALEEAYKAGGKPVTVEILETTLSKRMDDLEPTLIRHGYNERVLVEQFRIKLSDVRQFMRGNLDSARMLELTEEMREAGLPI